MNEREQQTELSIYILNRRDWNAGRGCEI